MKIEPVKDFNKLLTVDEVVLGGVMPANGNSREYITGNWRTQRPIYHRDRCIDCMFCWISCPDSAIVVKDAVMEGMNHDHCKGCGICAYICPTNPKSIEMVEGGEY